MSNQPKWTEERETELKSIVGTETPVSLDTVSTAADTLGNSTRSISSKLRKMGYEVATVVAKAKTFTDAEEEALVTYVTTNNGLYTYKEIAQNVLGDEALAKKVQGKLLSLDLSSNAKKSEPAVVAKKFTDEEEATIESMANAGKFLEEIATTLGREIKAVRGKCLSMLKSHGITYPKQEHTITKETSDVFDNVKDIETKTVEDIAAEVSKTIQGVKVMLTHRGIKVADYDGEKRSIKNAAKREKQKLAA